MAQEQHPALADGYEAAAGDGDAEGVETVEADEYDAVFGDGHDLMDVNLPDDSALSAREQALLKKLNEKLADIKFETCDYCLEEGFNMQVDLGMCATCKRDNGDPVRKWSAENGVHPGIYCFFAINVNLLTECFISAMNIPPCLKGLTDMEEMLIARVKACMQVRWTKGRQLCYQDHIVNFRQDITEIATKLPRLPEDTDVVIIRKEDVDMSSHVDFTVRREKVKAALQYKIAHDPDYADLTIDEEALEQLPERGSVAHRLPYCREGRRDGSGAAMPVGPDAVSEEDGDPDDDDNQFVGGLIDIGNQERPEVEQLRQGAAAVANGRSYEQTIVSHESI